MEAYRGPICHRDLVFDLEFKLVCPYIQVKLVGREVPIQAERYSVFNKTVGFIIEEKGNALYSLKHMYFVFWNTEIEGERHINEQAPKAEIFTKAWLWRNSLPK